MEHSPREPIALRLEFRNGQIKLEALHNKNGAGMPHPIDRLVASFFVCERAAIDAQRLAVGEPLVEI